MNKFFGYALMVTMFSAGTSWVKMMNQPSSGGGSSWSHSTGSWGGGSGYGGGGGGHK